MHPALRIEEILRCIFECLNAEQDYVKRRSLVNLALTCRTFSKPALEVLWFHLSSLVPVIRCLPDDACHEFVTDYDSKYGRGKRDLILIPKRELVEADWKRFKFYAPFVKSYSSPHPSRRSGKVLITDALLHDLQVHVSNTPIFPNLRTLSWYGDSETDNTFSMFLAPSLLDFTSALSSDILLVFLKRACKRLRTLHVTIDTHYRLDWTSPVSSLVAHLSTLESVHIDVQLTVEAIASVCMCPNLKSLRIPNDASDFCRALEGKASGRRLFFSSLVDLTIGVKDLPSLTTLLTLSRLEKLVMLRVNRPSGQYPPTYVVEQVFAELASACSHDVLETIAVENEVNYILTSVVPPLLPPHVLKHLFVFKRLWLFNTDLHFDLDDDTVEEMAVSWPRLGSFKVKYDREHGSCPKITLRSLVALVKHCCDLYHVTLSLRISSADLRSLERDVCLGGIQNCRLENLAFQDALIDDDVAGDPVRLAEFFSAVFPRLVSTFVYSGRQTPVWEKVNHALRPGVEGGPDFVYSVAPESLQSDPHRRYL